MDKEEIVTLLEELSDQLSEMGTNIAEDDLEGLITVMSAFKSDLKQVEEYLDQNATEDEVLNDD